MNTVVTSRQALLAASRTVARRQGLGGLSIRAVAAEARVSVGSVYNYFSGKTELLAATVEEVWMQILSAPEGEAPRDGFAAYVHWLFHRIQSGAGASARRCWRRWRRTVRCGRPPLMLPFPGSSLPLSCWTACWGR